MFENCILLLNDLIQGRLIVRYFGDDEYGGDIAVVPAHLSLSKIGATLARGLSLDRMQQFDATTYEQHVALLRNLWLLRLAEITDL